MSGETLGKKLSRRSMLKGSALSMGVGSTLLSPMSQAAIIAGKPHLDNRKVSTASHWGPGYLKVEGGKVVGTELHPMDQYPEAMNLALADAIYSPNRIKYPMVRKSFLEKGYKAGGEGRGKDEYVRVSWEKATKLVADEMRRVKSEHGNKSIFGGSYGWKSPGLLHNCFNNLYRLLNEHGGFIDDVNSYSTGAIRVILPHVFGISFYGGTCWENTIKHAEQIIFWGSDPVVTSKIGWVVPDHAAMVYMKKVERDR